MSLKSIGKLRDELSVCGCDPDECMGCDVPRKVREGLQAIEREISERYMELPKDADGVPIEMWERVEPDGYEGGKVASIEIRGNGTAWVGVIPDGWDTPTVYRADSVRHVKPDPVKKLLEEFGDWYKHVAGGCDEPGVIDEYAKRIREAVGA